MSEITPELIYWVARLDYVRVCFGWLVALCVIAIIGLVINAITTKITQCEEIDEVKRNINRLDPARYYGQPPCAQILEDVKCDIDSLNIFKDAEKRAWRIIRYVVVLFLSLIVGLVLTPTTKEMCAIIVIPKIANSEFVQKELPKSVESMIKIAQNYLEELADTNNGGDKR